MSGDRWVFGKRRMENGERGFLNAGGTANTYETDFYMEPPGFRKPGGGYDLFSKDLGHTKTWKVFENLPGLVNWMIR